MLTLILLFQGIVFAGSDATLCEFEHLPLAGQLRTFANQPPERLRPQMVELIADKVALATAESFEKLPTLALEHWTDHFMETLLKESSPRSSRLYPALLTVLEYRPELLQDILRTEDLQKLFISAAAVGWNRRSSRSERAYRAAIEQEISIHRHRPTLLKNILELTLERGLEDISVRAQEEVDMYVAFRTMQEAPIFANRIRIAAESLGIELNTSVPLPQQFPLLSLPEYQLTQSLTHFSLRTRWTETLLALYAHELPTEQQTESAEMIFQDLGASSYWSGLTPVAMFHFLKDLRTLARFYIENPESAEPDYHRAFESEPELFAELAETDTEALFLNRDLLMAKLIDFGDHEGFSELIERRMPESAALFRTFVEEEAIHRNYDVIFAPKSAEWALRLSQIPISANEVRVTSRRETLLATVMEPAIQWLVVMPPRVNGEDFPWRLWVSIAAFEATLENGRRELRIVVFPGEERYQVLNSPSATTRDRKAVQDALDNALKELAQITGVPVFKASEIDVTKLRLVSQRTPALESILDSPFFRDAQNAYQRFGGRTENVSDQELLNLEPNASQGDRGRVIQLFRAPR